MKRDRGRYDREASEDVEQRLVNLIVRVGDKGVASQLTSHLEGLASALREDVGHHRLITDTILDCARSLHAKSGVYGTLVGLLNAADGHFGREIADITHRELQGALEDHAPMAIRGLTRFAVELMNAHVISAASAVELLQTLVSGCHDDSPIARADWFAIVTMDALTLCGKSLAAEAPRELDALVSTLDAHAAKRQPLREVAPLLLPYGASTSPEEMVEHFDAMYHLLQSLRTDGAWSSAYLIAPHRAFTTEFHASSTHPFPPISLPKHTTGCTYPLTHRLRLLDPPTDTDAMMADADADGGAVGRDGRGGAARRPLAADDRALLEENVLLIVNAFALSHKDCAKLLCGYAEERGVDCASLFVEALLSLLLSLPSPRHSQMYYSCVIVDLCKLLTAFPVALEAALNKLFDALPRLDVQLSQRLADWVAMHVSNFNFSLAPFGGPWGAHLQAATERGDVDRPTEYGRIGAADSRVRFVRLTLSRMVHLSYRDRVARDLPPPFVPLLPPPPSGVLDWASAAAEPAADGADGATTTTPPRAELSSTLINMLRAKAAQADVTRWVETTLGGLPDRVAIVTQTLLHAGAKSVSHVEKLLEKFGWLLLHVAPTPAQRAELLAASCRYWRHSSQMSRLLCRKLLHFEILDAAAVLAHAFSPSARATLLEVDGWIAIDEVVKTDSRRQRDTASELKRAERRLDDASRDGRDDRHVLRCEDQMADAKAASERARRECKATFANLFAGICTVLSDANQADDASAAYTAEWRRVVLGHSHGIGRLHLHDFSLETVEIVAESSDVADGVRGMLFAPLRQQLTFSG